MREAQLRPASCWRRSRADKPRRPVHHAQPRGEGGFGRAVVRAACARRGPTGAFQARGVLTFKISTSTPVLLYCSVEMPHQRPARIIIVTRVLNIKNYTSSWNWSDWPVGDQSNLEIRWGWLVTDWPIRTFHMEAGFWYRVTIYDSCCPLVRLLILSRVTLKN